MTTQVAQPTFTIQATFAPRQSGPVPLRSSKGQEIAALIAKVAEHRKNISPQPAKL